jgi:hypothetical protein
MGETEGRAMRPHDWVRESIERGRYFNKEHAITGYQRRGRGGGTVLHPACVLEDRLSSVYAKQSTTYEGLRIARFHVQMPYWDIQDPRLPSNYAFVEAPERLTTTSVTVVAVTQDRIQDAAMGFHFDGARLPSLRERMQGIPFRGIAGNLGYFITEGLIDRKFRWSHNIRYPDLPLPTVLSYIGFHLFRDAATGRAHAAFAGAHPGAVAVRSDGGIEVIPRLEITRYRVTLWGQEFLVESINDPDDVQDVMLFTPGLWTRDVQGRQQDWETYAPEVPAPDRVNVFIANEGNGSVPVERVVKVWRGRAPLPSFGAILSFDPALFEKRFVSARTFGFLDQPLLIEPLAGTDLEDYVQVLGGFVPVVVDGRHVYCVETVDQIIANLRDYGNATSPIARCGRETNNFDPRVREPAGLLVQTEDEIGWVLFDGRHELSIGASVVDVAMILKKLQDDGLLPGKILQAFFVDGGSAMKVYAIDSGADGVNLELLNRVAAGSRNGAGVDPDGLNLYSTLCLRL